MRPSGCPGEGVARLRGLLLRNDVIDFEGVIYSELRARDRFPSIFYLIVSICLLEDRMFILYTHIEPLFGICKNELSPSTERPA